MMIDIDALSTGSIAQMPALNTAAYMELAYISQAEYTASERHILTPRPFLSLPDYADKYRVIPPGSRLPGRWNTAATPYWAGPMQAFSNKKIRQIALCCGTQLGKTEYLINALCYRIQYKPSNIIWVCPTEGMGKYFSRARIQPALEATMPDLVPNSKEDYQTLEMYFPGASLNIIASNSRTQMSGRPGEVLLRDEIDKFPAKVGPDSDSLSLTLARVKASWESRKIVDCSSPTLAGWGIMRQLDQCDVVNQFFVPCPHCNEYFIFDFQHIEWEKPDDASASYDVKAQYARRTAYYKCHYCEGIIHDSDKLNMLSRGYWAPLKESSIPDDEIESVGYVLSSIYSVWLRFGDLAERYVRCRQAIKETGSYTEMQDFHNGWLAMPWEEIIEPTTEPNIVLDCIDKDMPRGVVPADALCLVMGIDSQKDRFVYSILAYKRNSCHLVDHGAVQDFAALETLIYHKAYPIQGTNKYMRIYRALIDLGGDRIAGEDGTATEAVLMWLRKCCPGGGAKQVIFGCRGANFKMQKDIIINKPKLTTPSGKPLPGLITVAINTYEAKKLVNFRISQGRTRAPGGMTLHSETDIEFAKQVLGEELRIVKGKRVWVKIYDNHALDTLCYGNSCISESFYGGLRVIRAPIGIVSSATIDTPTPAPQAPAATAQPKPKQQSQPKPSGGGNPYLRGGRMY